MIIRSIFKLGMLTSALALSSSIFAYTYQYGSYSPEALKQAIAGDAKAQNQIGDAYYMGNGVAKDYKKAFEWYSKSAKQGNLDATDSLALMYGNGQYVAYNILQSEKLYQLAASQGHSASQYMLYLLYRDGESQIPRDIPKAVRYLIQSANLGYDDAQFDLAFRYEKGIDVPRDAIRALHYYRLAANQGHAHAQNNLAYLYEMGYGIAQNYDAAVYWYEKSLSSGNKTSAGNLGRLYAKGFGVEKDYKKAVQYFNMLDEKKRMDYLEELIEIYSQGGHGVEQNIRKANEYRVILRQINGF